MKNLSEKSRIELSRIQASVPKEWLGRLVLEKDGFEAVKETMTRAINDPEVSEEVRRKAEIILLSGFLDKKVEETEPVVSDLIDAYTSKEVLKAVIAKRLPKPKHAPSFKITYERYQKALKAYEAKYGTDSNPVDTRSVQPRVDTKPSDEGILRAGNSKAGRGRKGKTNKSKG